MTKRKTPKPTLLERIKLSENPFPGRTEKHRSRIKRALVEINDELSYHLQNTEGETPDWLPPLDITPAIEQEAVQSREDWQNADRDNDGLIYNINKQLRAANTIRVGTWYNTTDNSNALFMLALPITSPLPCEQWGALPLTRSQWRLVFRNMLLAHMRWRWIHSVRRYWRNDSYQVGKSFGWYMQSCKKLEKGGSTALWTGQAIYSPAVRKYTILASSA